MACLNPRLTPIADLLATPAPFLSAAHLGEPPRAVVADLAPAGAKQPSVSAQSDAPRLRSTPGGRPNAAQCAESILSETDGRHAHCLDLLPELRASASLHRQRSYWEEYDLPIKVPMPTLRGAGGGSDSARLVNPSILCRRGRLLLAARAMWPAAVQPPCTDVWRSHALLTAVAFDADSHAMTLAPSRANTTAEYPRKAAGKEEASQLPSCVADLTVGREEAIARGGARGAFTNAESADLIVEADVGANVDGNLQATRCARLGLPSSVGLGMEDPRLFDLGASVSENAEARPLNQVAEGPESPEDSVEASEEVSANAAEAAAASFGSGVLISYSAPKRQPQVSDCSILANRRAMLLMPLQPVAPPLALHWPAAAHMSDRNWVLFQHGGDVFAVFSIEPHVILRVGHSGRCEERHRTTNRFFARRFARTTAIHGGANPLLVRTSRGTQYYVSIFHTKDASLQYENFAYTFAAEPPFRITAVARRPLSLRGRRVRFASALTYVGHSHSLGEPLVGVSYGSDDEQGRFALMSLRVLLRDLVPVGGLSSLANASGLDDHRLQLPSEQAQTQATQALGAQTTGSSDAQLSVGQVHDGPGQCFIMRDVRFDAPSIKRVAAAAPQQCCAACRAVEYCTGFSWSPADGGACWLKQWTGTPTARNGFVSGHFSRKACCGCELRHGVTVSTGLAGGGNASFITRSVAQNHASCCERCLQSSSCGVWAWSPAIAEGGSRRGNAEGGRGGVGSCALYRTASIPSPLSHSYTSSLFAPMSGHVSGAAGLKRSVLFVHNHPPQQRLGSDRRLLALLQQVQRLGWKVAYAGADNYDPGPVKGRTLLSQMGIPLLAAVKDSDALAAFARQQDASVIVLCLWFWGAPSVPTRYLRALRNSLPHAKLVVMSDDVHHLRLMMQAEDEGHTPGKSVERIKDEEQKSYFYADHVLCISDLDKRAILKSLPPTKAMHAERFSVLRHVYADGVLFPLERGKPFAQRHGLVFVGNLNNPTNLNGLKWFLLEVWPRLRAAEPGMTLRVVGSLEGDSATQSGLPNLLRASAGVHAGGYVSDDDLGGVLQRSRIFIVPIRWATGVVTKQTLAHVHGVPTVVTPTAAMHVAPAPLDGASGHGDAWSHLLGRYVPVRVAAVAESAAEYAEAVLHIHRNASAWDELSNNAARYARSGGGGKGVCPTGMADDWLAFWAKLQTGVCSGAF